MFFLCLKGGEIDFMTNLKQKAGAVVATSALLLSIVPGVFAANIDVTVGDNGAGSHNTVKVEDVTSNKVEQSNTTNVVNVQTAISSTGGNEIKGTTGEGGDPSITTGDAKSTNILKVEGGSNTVVADSCGCEPTTVNVDVSGNGAHSKTKVKIATKSKKKTKQATDTAVYNEQYAKAKTGQNEIKNSTGSDVNSIETGDATTKNKAVVTSGSNFVGPTEVL